MTHMIRINSTLCEYTEKRLSWKLRKKKFLPIFFRKSEILRQKTSKYDSKLVILRTNSTGRKSSPDLWIGRKNSKNYVSGSPPRSPPFAGGNPSGVILWVFFTFRAQFRLIFFSRNLMTILFSMLLIHTNVNFASDWLFRIKLIFQPKIGQF